MDILKFLETNNSLTVGEEMNAYYQVVSNGSDEVWATFPVPADAEKVTEVIQDIATGFPMGRHHVRLQVCAKSGAVRAQTVIAIEGKSTVSTKTSRADEAIQHARALKANVDVSEQQLVAISQRYQVAETRNFELMEKLVSQQHANLEIMSFMQNIVDEREDREFRRAEHEANMKQIAGMAQNLLPVVMPLAMMVVQWAQAKFSEAINSTPPASPPPSPNSPPGQDSSTVN